MSMPPGFAVTTVDAAQRALPMVARFATTRDCFSGLLRVSRSVHAEAPAYIEHVHFPEGTDDDTIVRVLDGSAQVRDVKLLEVGHAAVERAARLPQLERLVVVTHSEEVESLPDSLCARGSRLASLRLATRFLEELPQSFGQLSSLETLDLSGCENLATLPESSTGQLPSLATLNLSGCRNLDMLPESICQLSSLATLDLSGCEGLTALPESISQLPSLATLVLSCCRSLTALPESTGQLSSIKTLDLSGCSRLIALPESTGQLSSLTTLVLSRCSSLAALPESVGQLSSLATLNLSHCWGLEALPESIVQLSSLVTLNLSFCKGLTALPESIVQLASLATLDLRNCRESVKLAPLNPTWRASRLNGNCDIIVHTYRKAPNNKFKFK